MRTDPFYSTALGIAYLGDAVDVLRDIPDSSVDLIVTSPPFALLRQKKYGNATESEYVQWITPFGHEAFRILKDSGSFVLDLGGSYCAGIPTRSLYNYRVLIFFCDDIGFHLAEDFFWHNPAKLPSPIEWVNKKKIRAKDSVNPIWWFSKTPNPKADVRNVLTPYSQRMQKLLKNPDEFYSPQKRPSGHNIGSQFAKDNGGAIPSNLLSIPNTESNSFYLRQCKKFGFERHPARFPGDLPAFFIKMLTDCGDTVLDLFAGSNTTGFIAETLNRKWNAIEKSHEYLVASAFRFLEGISDVQIAAIIDELQANTENVKLPSYSVDWKAVASKMVAVSPKRCPKEQSLLF